MQRISSDLIGPLPESFLGHKYVLHMVEHHTSFGATYPLKTKTEAIKYVIEFIDFCEHQTGLKLKEFLSDNGTEFCNYQLQHHLKQKGVVFLTTTPYTSQQNGKIERRNRTLMDCARTMLKDAKLPDDYWHLAINCANYLINRWPSRNLIVPFEKFTGNLITYNHLKVFGCLVYWRVNDNLVASKLDYRGQKMIFVGYTQSVKNYLLLDPKTKNLIKACDVVFDEKKLGFPEIMMNASPDRKPKSNGYEKSNDDAAFVTSHSSDVFTFKQALESHDSDEWINAMNRELSDLTQKGVYEVVGEVPTKPITTKWVLRKKSDGRYKARCVVRGLEQKQMYDTYAPTLHTSSLLSVLSIALTKKMVVKQLDISTAFLNSRLDEEIYVLPPPGVNDKFWKLKKALYGLKQAPRAWYKTFADFLKKDLNLNCSLADPCVFYSDKVIMAVYVDDIIIAADNARIAEEIINSIEGKFEVHDYADCSKYLGLNIEVKNDAIYIDQTEYINNILENFAMIDCNPTNVPIDNLDDFSNCPIDDKYPIKEILGSLNYIACRTRPDISLCVSYLGRFADKPSKDLWIACKRVLRYLKGTKFYRLRLLPANEWTINVFADASFRSSANSNATSGSILFIDKSPVNWFSKKQSRLPHSTCEAELTAALESWKSAEPIRQLLQELGINSSIKIHVDSSAAVSIMDNNAFKKSRYFAYDQKLLVSKINEDGHVSIIRVPSKDQLADALTKPLHHVGLESFISCCTQKGVL